MVAAVKIAMQEREKLTQELRDAEKVKDMIIGDVQKVIADLQEQLAARDKELERIKAELASSLQEIAELKKKVAGYEENPNYGE